MHMYVSLGLLVNPTIHVWCVGLSDFWRSKSSTNHLPRTSGVAVLGVVVVDNGNRGSGSDVPTPEEHTVITVNTHTQGVYLYMYTVVQTSQGLTHDLWKLTADWYALVPTH